MSNITTTYLVSSTPNTRIHKGHSLAQVIGDIQSGVLTRRMTKTINDQGFISVVYEGKTHEDLRTCLFACFLSQEEPKMIAKALSDSAWVEAMQEELLQFKLQQSAFLYGKIKEEVYVCQPLGFEDPGNPDKIYKVVKALYGSHQAPRAWKFGFTDVRTDSTPMDTENPLLKDSDGDDVDVHLYRSMIGSLMYLTSSRPNIMFADATDIMAVAKSKLWFLSPPSSTEAEYVAASSVLDKQSSMIGIGDTSSGVQFWQTATASTLENGDMEITATIDGKVKVVSEASIRRHLKLEDSDGISDLPTTEIFEQLALMGVLCQF
ncbi:putative ribonuclease H-like domain-containing protein [Tanacetum coccineum]